MGTSSDCRRAGLPGRGREARVGIERRAKVRLDVAEEGRASDAEVAHRERLVARDPERHHYDDAGDTEELHRLMYIDLMMAIADNSSIQTPQPLFGGYSQPTVPGIVLDGIEAQDRARNT